MDKQQKFISQSSEGWEVQDQAVGKFKDYEDQLPGSETAGLLVCSLHPPTAEGEGALWGLCRKGTCDGSILTT